MEREDLVRRVAAFGADIPTTPMYWKRHGNELGWIVRQMSWKPCWCPPSDTARTPHVSKVFRESKKLFKDEPLQDVKTEAKEEPPTSPRDDAALPPLREHTDDEDNASLSCEEELWLDEAETAVSYTHLTLPTSDLV